MPFYLEIYIYIKIIVHFILHFLYVLMLSLIFNYKVIKFFATGYMNRLTYLYQNGYYWSMSPNYFYSGTSAAYEFYQDAAGYATNRWVTYASGLRPVINLQSDVTISGKVYIIKNIKKEELFFI